MPAGLPALRPFLDPARVQILPPGIGREAVLPILTDVLAADWNAVRRRDFLAALINRESVTTTGLGGGFSLPHVRCLDLDRPRIALGLCASGINWNSIDRQPVKVVALLASREADHQEHLRLMAALAAALRRPGLVDQLAVATAQDAVEILATAGQVR